MFLRTSEAGKRGLEDIMNFKDEERYVMYFACKENPLFTFAFNSFVYNAILKLNNTKKIRILGPKATASSIKEPVYFMMVDENNSLIAVIKPIYSQERVSGDEFSVEKGQLDMFVKNNYFSLSTTRNPSPIWGFDTLNNEIKALAPEEVEVGVLVSDAGNLTNESDIEEAKEQVNEPDLSEEEILDADAYDSPEPSPEVEETEEEEMTLEDKIVVMEEHLSTMPEDEDVREELDKLKEELLETKQEKSIQEEEQEIEEEIQEAPQEEPEVIEVEETEEEDYDDIIDDDDLEEIKESKEDEDFDYDDLFDID